MRRYFKKLWYRVFQILLIPAIIIWSIGGGLICLIDFPIWLFIGRVPFIEYIFVPIWVWLTDKSDLD